MRGTLLFYHISGLVMSPPWMILFICQCLGYKQHQHDPGYYFSTASDGDDDHDEKRYCIFKYNYFI